MTTRFDPFALTDAHFEKVKELLYRTCGIDLKPGKESLVKNRLAKRLRTLGMADFDAYLDYVVQDASRQELGILVDSMTTNKTSFFREMPHYDYLCQQLLPAWKTPRKQLRFWSAGCSTGEEPYSLAMLLREKLPDIDAMDVRILATDISYTVLDKARKGTFAEVQDVPGAFVQKYFRRTGLNGNTTYQIDNRAGKLVHFAALNLMGLWPMKGPFDVIFCRNVMIYFDRPTRQRLVQRFYELLRPGGHLFIGHSESLTDQAHSFDYVQPATYLEYA